MIEESRFECVDGVAAGARGLRPTMGLLMAVAAGRVSAEMACSGVAILAGGLGVPASHQQRMVLACLVDRVERDIGVTRAAVRAKAPGKFLRVGIFVAASTGSRRFQAQHFERVAVAGVARWRCVRSAERKSGAAMIKGLGCRRLGQRRIAATVIAMAVSARCLAQRAVKSCPRIHQLLDRRMARQAAIIGCAPKALVAAFTISFQLSMFGIERPGRQGRLPIRS